MEIAEITKKEVQDLLATYESKCQEYGLDNVAEFIYNESFKVVDELITSLDKDALDSVGIKSFISKISIILSKADTALDKEGSKFLYTTTDEDFEEHMEVSTKAIFDIIISSEDGVPVTDIFVDIADRLLCSISYAVLGTKEEMGRLPSTAVKQSTESLMYQAFLAFLLSRDDADNIKIERIIS